jgi:hypothetical protein
MNDETADNKKNVEELARESGIYLSPERLSTTERRIKDEERRKAALDAEGAEPQNDQKPLDRGVPRPVGRPRGSRSATAIGERQSADQLEVGAKKPQKGLYIARPKLRRLF